MNIPLQQPAASSTDTSDDDNYGTCSSTNSEETTDGEVEISETEVVTMEELMLVHVDIM